MVYRRNGRERIRPCLHDGLTIKRDIYHSFRRTLSFYFHVTVLNSPLLRFIKYRREKRSATGKYMSFFTVKPVYDDRYKVNALL